MRFPNKDNDFDDFDTNPIKLVYDEKRASEVDRDEEVAVLRACGYPVPKDEEGLNQMALKMLDFLDSLNNRERLLIKSNAETIATRVKMIKQAGYKMEDFTTCDQQTLMEYLNSTSRRKSDIFENMRLFKEEDKQEVIESMLIGFEILNSVIDRVEDIIIEVGYQK